MKLKDVQIKAIKPLPQAKKYFDGGGLFLLVTPNGGKWWRFKYRFHGKERLLSLGVYPGVSLKDAREKKDELKKLLDRGIDPGEHRKVEAETEKSLVENSFEKIAVEWLAKESSSICAGHLKVVKGRLEKYVFPYVGNRQPAEILPKDLLSISNRIIERGAVETAHRVLGACGQIFRFAVITGRAESDPTRDLRGALPQVKRTHFPALTDPANVSNLLKDLYGYEGSEITRAALKLAPLFFVRPGELRSAKWSDIDLCKAQWSYMATKTSTPHIVPLSRQAVEILKDLQLLTGSGPYVFPSARTNTRPMSDNTINAAMRRLGIEKDVMTGHGFRAMARTMLEEVLKFPAHLIEHQLAHTVKDPLGRAYNRTTHIEERARMMQAWADYLDELRNDNK